MTDVARGFRHADDAEPLPRAGSAHAAPRADAAPAPARGAAAGEVQAAANRPRPLAARLYLPAWTLWRREMVRFFRQPNRVVSALVSPLMLWVMLGLGLDDAFILPQLATAPHSAAAPGGAETTIGYAEYFFPGAISMTLFFTAIFSTITVIEDRREGFLQGVMVAPVSRLAIAMGKVLGGASIAMIHGLVLVALWPLIGPWPGAEAMLLACFHMLVLAIGMTAMGLCLAWQMDSTAGFHAVMMLFMMPMWFLSGAVFPMASAPQAMQAIMWANPMTYGQAAISGALLPAEIALAAGPQGLGMPGAMVGAIDAAVAAGLLLLASVLVSRPRKDGSG